MMLGYRSLAALALTATVLSACSRKQEPPQPTPTTSAEREPDRPPTTPPETPRDTNPAPDAGAESRRLRGVLEEMVFFDYDDAGIRTDARGVLDRKAQVLQTNPNVMIRIEGHADERGSVEYNLALSLRRANSIRDYLTNFGISGTRFEVVPMGEERPAASGTTEDAYARNRRGEFHITRGGDNLVSR